MHVDQEEADYYYPLYAKLRKERALPPMAACHCISSAMAASTHQGVIIIFCQASLPQLGVPLMILRSTTRATIGGGGETEEVCCLPPTGRVSFTSKLAEKSV